MHMIYLLGRIEIFLIEIFAEYSQIFAKSSQNLRKTFAKRLQNARKTFANDRGGSDMPKCKLSSLFIFRLIKMSIVAGIGGSWSRNPIVVTFGLASGLRISKISIIPGIGGGPCREI